MAFNIDFYCSINGIRTKISNNENERWNDRDRKTWEISISNEDDKWMIKKRGWISTVFEWIMCRLRASQSHQRQIFNGSYFKIFQILFSSWVFSLTISHYNLRASVRWRKSFVFSGISALNFMKSKQKMKTTEEKNAIFFKNRVESCRFFFVVVQILSSLLIEFQFFVDRSDCSSYEHKSTKWIIPC